MTLTAEIQSYISSTQQECGLTFHITALIKKPEWSGWHPAVRGTKRLISTWQQILSSHAHHSTPIKIQLKSPALTHTRTHTVHYARWDEVTAKWVLRNDLVCRKHWVHWAGLVCTQQQGWQLYSENFDKSFTQKIFLKKYIYLGFSQALKSPEESSWPYYAQPLHVAKSARAFGAFNFKGFY